MQVLEVVRVGMWGCREWPAVDAGRCRPVPVTMLVPVTNGRPA
jgi:hypothetical protein